MLVQGQELNLSEAHSAVETEKPAFRRLEVGDIGGSSQRWRWELQVFSDGYDLSFTLQRAFLLQRKLHSPAGLG